MDIFVVFARLLSHRLCKVDADAWFLDFTRC